MHEKSDDELRDRVRRKFKSARRPLLETVFWQAAMADVSSLWAETLGTEHYRVHASGGDGRGFIARLVAEIPVTTFVEVELH